MSKIVAKAGLVMGTNMFLHIANKGGTDISITDNGDGTGTIDSSTTDFTASSSVAGVTNRPVAVGDILTISHAAQAGNKNAQIAVTSVAANSIGYDDIDTLTDESAGADINLVAVKKTYQFVEVGGLSFVDGVGGIVLTSKMVDLWDATDLDIYDPAFTSIEPRAKSMASLNGWEPHDTNTLKSLRDIALEIRPDATSTATKIYPCVRSGAFHAVTDQLYLWSATAAWDAAPVAAVTTGYINELVLAYDYNDGTPVDNRGSWFVRCAEPGKTIAMQELTLTYAEIVSVNVSNSIDPKLANAGGVVHHTDVEITTASSLWENVLYNLDATGTYSGDVDGSSRDFTGYIEGDSQTNETVHEKINYLWRQPGNINNDGGGAQLRGDKQWPMTVFVGDGFTVNAYLLNYNASQRNNLTVVDENDVVWSWPTIYTLVALAALLIQGGTFSVIHANTFGTSDAVYLQDESAADQKDITILATNSIIIAFSTYNVDGHTPGQPIDVIISWNKPGSVEPDNLAVTISGDQTVTMTPTADPSYIAA